MCKASKHVPSQPARTRPPSGTHMDGAALAGQACAEGARAIHSPSMLSAQIWKPSSLEISNTRPFLGFFSVMLSLRFCSCCSQSMSGELKPPSSSSAAFGSARERAERQRPQQEAWGARTAHTIAKPTASGTGIVSTDRQ